MSIRKKLLDYRVLAPKLAVLSALILFQLNCGNVDAGGLNSPWVNGNHHKVRLVTGMLKSSTGKEQLLAGVHIRLEKGWKTYWRFPGDSGVPPMFNWRDSRNLESAKILWPAPQRFKDQYSTTIGYKDEVVFPILIQPVNPELPVHLNVKLEFGVCDDVCFFAEAKLDVRVSKDEALKSRHNSLLQQFVTMVPETVKSPSGSKYSIRRVNAVLEGEKPHIIVEANYPENARNRDLFVEGPKDFYLPPPSFTRRKSVGLNEYILDLKGGDDPKLLKGKTLTFTLVSTDGQVEIRQKLN